MSQGEMVSRAVTQVPEGKNAFAVWIEKILRAHYLDIKRIYNNEISTDSIEFVKTGNLIGDDDNWRIIMIGNNLELQRKESGTWVKKGAVTA